MTKSTRAKGRVFLVGAGPGDPGLLTLRGRECIEAADVVIHDALVDGRLLRFARTGAEVVAMGKRGGVDRRNQQQAAIHERMIREAGAGKIVTRLKGGDPFVFGRGGEEALGLAAAGIPFEVVPGISSAIAVPAYAGIPVTHRGLNSSFAVVTGHEAADATAGLDWAALARIDCLVLLMALRRLREALGRLRENGVTADTPAACIRSGTRPGQEVVIGTVGDLADRVERAGIEPPAVIVVGEVVSLREKIAWFDSRPLLGRRIVVTRPRHQALGFRDRLEGLGAEVLEGPTIEIASPESMDAFDEALSSLATFDWILFTSRNGVEVFFRRLFALGREISDLGTARLGAIGPVTAAALRERGLAVSTVPARYRAEGLIEALAGDVSGKRVLLPRAAGARMTLPEALAAHGAEVVDVPTYQAVRTVKLPPETVSALRAEEVDAVTFTSSSTVLRFRTLLHEAGLSLGRARIACIGPITAETARDIGWRVDVEAREYTTEGLVDALVDTFSDGG